MQLTIHKTGSNKPGKLKVSDAVFGVAYNESLVHQVLTAFMAAARSGTKLTRRCIGVRSVRFYLNWPDRND